MVSVTFCVVIYIYSYLFAIMVASEKRIGNIGNQVWFGDKMESSACSFVTHLWLTIFHSYCIQIYQLLPVKVENSLQ